MDFSIIIVSWQARDRLRDNLAALVVSAGEVTWEVIVVDNNSSDGTVAMVAQEFPEVLIISNTENRGFAAACNQGLRQAQGAYSILLNPDMKVLPTTLADLKTWLDRHAEADVTGICLEDEAGEIIQHVRHFPTWLDQLAIVLKIPHLVPGVLRTYLRSDFDYAQAARVDSVRGSFFAIKAEALKRCGLLDERYFLWFEEVDYCRTMAAAGGEVWYTPAAQAVDYVGQSFKLLPRSAKQTYFKNSMLAYFAKWQPGWRVTILGMAWWLAGGVVRLGDMIGLRSRTKT